MNYLRLSNLFLLQNTKQFSFRCFKLACPIELSNIATTRQINQVVKYSSISLSKYFLPNINLYHQFSRSSIFQNSDYPGSKYIPESDLIVKEDFKECVLRDKMVKVLNVAEKNDASKNLANILSRGGSVRVSLKTCLIVYIDIFV